jgi:hypothetical protein
VKRQQATLVENAFHHRQHARMDGNLLVELAVNQKVVDAPGARAFERVVAAADPEIRLQPQQIPGQGVGVGGVEHVLDQAVAVARDPLQVRASHFGVHHATPRADAADEPRSRVSIMGSTRRANERWVS